MEALKLSRLYVLATIVFSAAAAHAAASNESAYPLNKPIRIIVPFTAGSATDLMARIVGPGLVERWGKKISTQGAAARSSTPEALDRLIRDEIETRRKVWKAAGVKVE